MVARVKEEELHLSVVHCFSLRKAVKRKSLHHPFERKSKILCHSWKFHSLSFNLLSSFILKCINEFMVDCLLWSNKKRSVDPEAECPQTSVSVRESRLLEKPPFEYLLQFQMWPPSSFYYSATHLYTQTTYKGIHMLIARVSFGHYVVGLVGCMSYGLLICSTP